MSDTAREMTLAEYMACLPEFHRARSEYADLLAAPSDARPAPEAPSDKDVKLAREVALALEDDEFCPNTKEAHRIAAALRRLAARPALSEPTKCWMGADNSHHVFMLGRERCQCEASSRVPAAPPTHASREAILTNPEWLDLEARAHDHRDDGVAKRLRECAAQIRVLQEKLRAPQDTTPSDQDRLEALTHAIYEHVPERLHRVIFAHSGHNEMRARLAVETLERSAGAAQSGTSAPPEGA